MPIPRSSASAALLSLLLAVFAVSSPSFNKALASLYSDGKCVAGNRDCRPGNDGSTRHLRPSPAQS